MLSLNYDNDSAGSGLEGELSQPGDSELSLSSAKFPLYSCCELAMTASHLVTTCMNSNR